MEPTQTPMDWQRLIDSPAGERGYVQWLDEGRADTWFRRAAYLSSDEVWNALKVEGAADGLQIGRIQIRLIHEIWEAVSFGYLSCDLSPWADPIYRGEIVRAYGQFRGRLNPAVHSINLAFPQHAYVNPLSARDGLIATFATDAYEEYLRDPAHSAGRPYDTGANNVLVVQQYALAQNAELSVFCEVPSIYFGDCYFPMRSRNCPTRANAIEDEQRWGPSCWAWRSTPTAMGGQVVILPMMRGAYPTTREGRPNVVNRGESAGGGVYEIIRAVARSCAERGARRVIDDAIKNAFFLNLQTALEYDLLPAELIEVSAHAGVDLTRYNGNGPRPAEWDRAFPVAYAAAAAIGAATVTVAPWLGAALGLVVGFTDLFTNLLGVPRLVITDLFGQIKPVFQTWAVSGRPGADTPANRPRQVVPDPPDFTPREHESAVRGFFLPLLITGGNTPTEQAKNDTKNRQGAKPTPGGGTAVPTYTILPADPVGGAGGREFTDVTTRQQEPAPATSMSTPAKVAAWGTGLALVGTAVGVATDVIKLPMLKKSRKKR